MGYTWLSFEYRGVVINRTRLAAHALRNEIKVESRYSPGALLMLLASWAVSKLVFLPREFSVTLKAPWQVVLILTYLLRGLLVYRGNGYTLYNSRRGFSHESRGENNRDCAYVPWENDGDRRPLATLAFDRKHFLIYHTFLPQESQEPHFACNAEFARLLHITMRSVEYTRSTINKLNTKNEKKKNE